MFPTIFTLGIEGLGPLTGEGSGMLNTAIVGGAIIPLVQGYIADRMGIHHAFFLPAVCYLYIVFFAIKGLPRKRAPRTPGSVGIGFAPWPQTSVCGRFVLDHKMGVGFVVGRGDAFGELSAIVLG